MKKYNTGKILIIRLGAIGDVVHTTSLFRAVKKSYPNIEIHYLTSEIIKPLLIHDKDLDKILTINPKFKLFSLYTKQSAEELKHEKYDLAINLQPSVKTRALVFLAGIRKSINYKKNYKVHAVTNFWQCALKVFPNLKEEENLKIYLSETAVKKAKDKLKDFNRPFVVISAGGVFSKREGRTYPLEKWIELGNKIEKKYKGTIILTGAAEDKEFLEPLNNIKNSINYIGKCSLEESCAVISQADLMISGDSGPLHIACALGIKSLGLFGSTPIERTGCYSSGINIISGKKCAPCNKRKCKFIHNSNEIYAPCMKEIAADEIMTNIDRLIKINL